MNKSEKIIVGLGEILWDIFPDKKVLGGAPSNFAYHVSQMGYNGCAISAIGQDSLGEEILNTLKDKKLNYIIEQTSYPTGSVQVTLDNYGSPKYKILENVAWDNIPFSNKIEEIARNCAAVCFGTLGQRNTKSRDTINKFLAAMPKDSLKVFDINLRQNYYSEEVIFNSLKLSNILKLNEDELPILEKFCGLSELDPESFCKELIQKYNLDLVIFTQGSVGSFVISADYTSYLETPVVEVCDTVGAGDSFTAVFISSYLHGIPVNKAHELAVKTSAYVCTQNGGMPIIPDSFKI